ncbi:MAG TPA: hypothetical protein VMU94_20625 [Streptosporangiaceae bacterium]|nr:hypothetical protein [Streptosporangiaceae bacterium]
MTDEQQIRSLLTLAAELPDDIQPPVRPLLDRGRRERKLRAVLSVLSVLVIAAGALTLPPIIRALGPGQTSPGRPRIASGLFPAKPSQPHSGPSAAQLSRFRWSALLLSPLGPRSQPVLAWTGRELLELGGTKKGSTTSDGAAFNPATGRWRTIAPVRANVGFSHAVDVWTGHQLFLANGQTESCPATPGVRQRLASCLPHAGLYDPAANRWTTTLLPRQLDGVNLIVAAWTGRQVILAGVRVVGAKGKLAIAAYAPSSNHWQIITPDLPAGHLAADLAMVATPSRMLLWSLWSRTTQTSKNSYAVASGVDILALGRDSRWNTLTGNWPQHQVVEGPVYGGGTVLIPPGQIWCGLCSHPAFYYPAYLANAATLTRRTVPPGPLVAHPGLEPDIWLWNGATALAANATDDTYGPAGVPRAWISQMAAFDPASRSWHTLPVPPGRPPIAASPIWAGRQLLLLTANGKLLAFHA